MEAWPTWRDLRYYFTFWSSVPPVGDGLQSLQLSTSGAVIARVTLVVLRLYPATSKMHVKHLEFFSYHLPFWSHYYFRFTAAAIYFRCSNTSRVVVHTAIVSDDLENVSSALGIFYLSFIFIELLLLLVYGGCYLFLVFHYVVDVCHSSIVPDDLEMYA
jgi:hypothetical protein